MKNKGFRIIDETSDRKYFTIVPNYILNHSSGIDKALYIEMKRAAGENGLCFMTEQTMCKKLGIGEKRLHRSLDYLLDHQWIEFTGTTPSKTRPVKTYKMIDIWNKNADYYSSKKIPSKSGVSKDTRQKEKDTLQKQDMIPARRRVEEEPILRRTLKKNTPKKYSSLKDIKEADLIEISQKYKVSLGFVKLQLEKMTNWLEAKGKRYKNYRRALMNWVLGDIQRSVERRQDDTKRGIDARNI